MHENLSSNSSIFNRERGALLAKFSGDGFAGMFGQSVLVVKCLPLDVGEFYWNRSHNYNISYYWYMFSSNRQMKIEGRCNWKATERYSFFERCFTSHIGIICEKSYHIIFFFIFTGRKEFKEASIGNPSLMEMYELFQRTISRRVFERPTLQLSSTLIVPSIKLSFEFRCLNASLFTKTVKKDKWKYIYT